MDHRLTAVVDRQDEDDGTGRQRGKHGPGHMWSGDGHRDLSDDGHDLLPFLSPLFLVQLILAAQAVGEERRGPAESIADGRCSQLPRPCPISAALRSTGSFSDGRRSDRLLRASTAPEP